MTLVSDCCRKLFFILSSVSIICSVSFGQDCSSGPVDCIFSDWEEWTECSHTCGNSGVRERKRDLLLPATCGGACSGDKNEFETCNRHCCCDYSPWSKWDCKGECSNSTEFCDKPGVRFMCHRSRYRIPEVECEGVCEAKTFDKWCSILCCYTTCVVKEWSFWGSCQGQCEQDGVKYRTREVEREPKCGADPCPELTDHIGCRGRCCPVDCVLGDWSVWTECNTTCGIGHKTRMRFVQKPECFGKECPEDPTSTETVECEKYVNEDCTVSPWSTWSSCGLNNGFCGEGKKTRDRTIITESKCKGVPCPDLNETQVCYGRCCRQDCVVSEWTEWSLCSIDCGVGNRTRTREVTTQPSCNGSACPPLSDRQECRVDNKIDCVMAPWTEWSVCNNECGNGTAFRSRKMQTKAYCGGAECADTSLEDEKTCYREVNKDCEVSPWEEWGPCILTCLGGFKTRTRNITSNKECNGLDCSPLKDAQVNCMDYHCEHNCDGGICSCNHGYRLEDTFRCREVLCPRVPSIKYCGPEYTLIINCIYPKFDCDGNKFGNNCTAYCSDDKVLKGDVDNKVLTCQLNGEWTTSQIFCAPKNRAPTDLILDANANKIPENTQAGTCIGSLQTTDDSYDKHTYSIVNDEKSIFSLHGRKVCLTDTTNYETLPIKWTATFKSTDLEGEFITKTFSFEIINENDKPKDVKLDNNKLMENSPEGTLIGCMEGIDDDPGQSVSLLLVDSDDGLFETYTSDDGKLCLKVKGKSDPLCGTHGGEYCLLNYEKQKIRRITVLATDDGSPPKDAYIDVNIYLQNANDKPVEVKLDPEKVLEEVEPGQPISDLVTVDEDEEQTHTYELLQDTEGIFSIKDGKLLCSRKLDYESESSKEFVIQVKSTDGGDGALSVVSTIKFKIDDVNEAPFDLQLKSFDSKVNEPSISENKRSFMIGEISVKDQDGDDLTINVQDTANGRIAYMNKRCKALTEVKSYCTARLIAFDSFNFETEPTIPLIINATDGKGLSVQKNLTLRVIDVNDQPTDILINGNSTSEIEVPENKNHFKIADLSAEDEDVADTQTFSLLTAGLFEIVDNTHLMTSSTANLDYETQDTYEITILVMDNGNPPMTMQKTFTMKVTNENEAPTLIYLSNDKVNENSEDGTVIGKLTTDDPDNVKTVIQTFTYSLTDDASGRLKIVGDELQVKKSDMMCNGKLCILNYESEPQLNVVVMVTDNGSPPLSYEQKITIYIQDTNDPPEDIRLSRDSIRENEPASTVLGKLSAMDQDVGQSFYFTLVDNQDIFMLAADNTMTTKVPLNHEQKSLYNVTVRCTDNGSPAAFTDAVLTVNVLNVNEVPEYTGQSSLQVSENLQSGTIVGQLIASDVDNDDALTFDIGSSTDFRVSNVKCEATDPSGIECTGDLETTTILDYEVHSTYPLSVTVTDKYGASKTQTVTVIVKDENDDPQNILLNGKSVDVLEVDENIENVKIADLSTDDPDVGQTFTYNIKSGDEGIFEIQGNELKVKSGVEIDYEKKNKYILLLEVTDSGTPPKALEKTVTINVQNINEAPTSVSISGNQVEENSDEGTVIGQLTAEDPDNTDQNVQTFTYILIDNAEGRFKVQNGQLQVAISNKDCLQNGGDSCKLDYEGTRSYVVKVLVTDSGHPSKSNTFDLSIEVLDANDPPRNIKLSDYKVEELAPKGTEIGKLTVDDQDRSQTHTFTLEKDDNGLFEVTSDGAVRTATDQRLDVTIVYEITVRATDSGTPQKQVEGTFSITATGVNEAPVSVTFTPENAPITFAENEPVVMENSPVDSVIGTVVAKDQDPDQALTFSVKAKTDVQYIKVDTSPDCTTESGMTSCKMKILVAEIMDHESMPDLIFIIEVTDKDGMKIVELFRLSIQDENEAPTDLLFSSDKLEVNENLQGETIGIFQVIDPDDGDSHVFKLTNDGGGNFAIDNKGRLSTSAGSSLDYEATKSVDITVSVNDAKGLSFEKSYNVSILDVNEAPTKIVLTNNKIPEMSPVDTVVGQLQATDPDNGQRITYKLTDDSNGRFKVVGDEVRVNSFGEHCEAKGRHFCTLDYESVKSYDIVVKATDSGNVPLSVEFTLTIDIEDGNDVPTDLNMVANSIPENTPVGQTVATFTAKDEDEGQTLTYILVSGGNDMFSVTGNTLMLTKPLDFEEQSMYNLTIEVTDNGVPPKKSSGNFTLKLLNSNEEPYNLQVEPTTGSHHFDVDQPTVEENHPINTLIGQLVVLDHDSQDQITFYTVNPEIELYNQKCVPLTNVLRCTADIRSREVFDFEAKSSVSLEFTATDIEGASIKKTVTLRITNSNDAPTDILIDGQSKDSIQVLENSKDIKLASLSAVDPDVGQTHSFSILSETQYFYIVGKDLKVTSAAELDYEREPVHKINIRVSDHANPPLYYDKVIEITLTDVNEKPGSVTLSRNRVAEDSKDGDLIGMLNTFDPDNVNKQVQTFEYKLVDNAGNRFKLEGNNLLVSSIGFDYEDTKSYTLKVSVTDSGEPRLSLEMTFTILVTNSNDAPRNLRISAQDVDENAELGTEIGVLTAEDDDSGQTLSYSVEDNDYFSISGNKLLVNGPIDFESKPVIPMEITVTDNGIPQLSAKATFQFQVHDKNDVPDLLDLVVEDKFKGNIISEDTLIKDVIGTMVAEDPDQVDHLVIEITSTADDTFKLSSSIPECSQVVTMFGHKTKCTVKLQLAKAVNFEDITKPLEVTVKVLDKGKLELTRSWSFTVSNVNEPPRDIIIESEVKEIPENMGLFVIGKLKSIDDDKGDIHTYHIVKNWESFKIEKENRVPTLKVRPSGLDFESRQEEEVIIRSTDKDSLSYTKTFKFRVLDVNEAPSKITLSIYEVSNAAKVGQVVAQVEVIDPDNAGSVKKTKQTHTCTVGGDGLGVLKINLSDMTLQVQSVIPLDIDMLNITITCEDDGIPVMSKTEDISLAIKAIVKIPKGIILKNQKKVQENVTPFTVGTFKVINLLTSEPIDFVFFFLKRDDIPFEINFDNELVVSRALDYESKSEHLVEVEAGGPDNLMLDANFTILVEDVNEAPHGLSIIGSRVAENSDSDTVIGSLKTQDSEIDQKYAYTLLAVASGLDVSLAKPELKDTFKLEDGIVKVGPASQNLNYEQTAIFSLLINTMDSAPVPLSYNGTIRILVEDMNDPPNGVTLDNSKVAENSNVGTVVGMFAVQDEDKNQTHKCVVLNLNDVPFKTQNGLQLVVSRKELDFETNRKYIIEVQCIDVSDKFSSLQIRKAFTINITNVNEPPYDIMLSKSEIAENSDVGELVGELKATDDDSTTVTFSLEGEQTDFVIQGDHSLVSNIALDYETKSTYTIIVKAVDDEGLSSTQEFTIKVLDVNEPPTQITLDKLTVDENSLPGTVIGTLKTEDLDKDQTFTYKVIESAPESGYFSIQGNKLVTGDKALDFEKVTEHQIFINSTDSGKPPKTIQAEFTIAVKDVNEPPIKIIFGTLEPIPENAPANTVVSKIQVDDPDADQSHLCSILTSPTPFSILTNEMKEMNLVLIGVLDFESKAEYQMDVQCTDGKFKKETSITVRVQDVNEAPELITLSGTNSIVANAQPGYVIGKLLVKDPDIGQKFTFRIIGKNSDILEIKDANLQMSTAIPLSYLEAENPVIQVKISAADNGNPSLSINQTFSLPITNMELVVEELPDITIDNKTLKEDATVGTVIGALHSKEKLGKDIVFELVNNNEGLFGIKDNKFLTLAKNLSSVEGHSRNLTIKVTNTQTFESSKVSIIILIERIDKCYKNGKTCDENARCLLGGDGNHACQCEIGFTGDGYTCTDTNNCIVTAADGKKVPGNPCQNQGTCIDQDNSYACKCAEGFSGPNCEISVKPSPCQSSPCKNKAACVPDEQTENKFTCECAIGWMGDICDKSIDDCKRLKCVAGTCVDKHRTINCLCPPDRKGVWCEYKKTTCLTTNTCTDKSQTCIPKLNEDASDCVACKTHCITLKVKKPTNVPYNKEEFIAKTKEIINSLSNRQVGGSTVGRKKRATTDTGVDTYVVDVKDNGDGTLDVIFAVRAQKGTIYEEEEALYFLVKACKDTNSQTNVETEYCPAIMATQSASTPVVSQPESGLPIPIIAGAAGGGVVLIIIVIVIIVVCKKKKNNNTVDPTREGAANKNKEGTTETDSRRSSGYDSLRKKNQEYQGENPCTEDQVAF